MRRTTQVRAGVLVLLGMGLFACTSAKMGGQSGWGLPYPPPGYAHHVGSHALELFWNCTRPEPNVLRMDGVAANPFSGADVLFLKFELAGVDAQGREVSSAHFESPNIQIWMDESAAFRLDLPTTGQEVRVDLFYEYGFHMDDEISLLAAVGDVPLLLAQGARNVVRDACSDTQHLAR
jgi:hypothetical protein